MTARLIPKIARDSATLATAFVLAISLFYLLRRVDPSATVDGLASLFLALQVVIIGFACASAAGAICWLLFGMPGRGDTRDGMSTATRGLQTYFIMQRLTWLAVFFLLFSRSVGH